MTYKNTMTITKPWPTVGHSGFSFSAIIAKLKNAVKIEIPVGYQDEAGFHYGVETAKKENQ